MAVRIVPAAPWMSSERPSTAKTPEIESVNELGLSLIEAGSG